MIKERSITAGNYMNKNKYFKTSSFYLAVFLFAKGLELVNIGRFDPKKCMFIFVDTPLRESLIGVFSFGKEDDPEVMVDARKFITSIKMLKEKLYQEEF